MVKIILILTCSLLVVAACSQTKTSPPAIANRFPTEIEATEFLKVGTAKQDVIARFGQPQPEATLPNGLELFYYVRPPAVWDAHPEYGGFQVIFKDGKVSKVNIIHKPAAADSK